MWMFLSWGWSCTANNWWCHPVGSLGTCQRVNSAWAMLWPHPWTGLGVQLWTWYLLWVCWACERHQTCLRSWALLPSLLPGIWMDLLILIPLQDTRMDVGSPGCSWGKCSFRSTFTSSQVAWGFSDFLKGKGAQGAGPWWAKCVVPTAGCTGKDCSLTAAVYLL